MSSLGEAPVGIIPNYGKLIVTHSVAHSPCRLWLDGSGFQAAGLGLRKMELLHLSLKSRGQLKRTE